MHLFCQWRDYKNVAERPKKRDFFSPCFIKPVGRLGCLMVFKLMSNLEGRQLVWAFSVLAQTGLHQRDGCCTCDSDAATENPKAPGRWG
jgi:hypothetical protein